MIRSLRVSQEDEKRVLTDLGRQQAHLTGKRIASLMQAENGACSLKSLRVSGMTRARETANIIAEHLEGVEVEEPDPEFNEGRYVTSSPSFVGGYD